MRARDRFEELLERQRALAAARRTDELAVRLRELRGWQAARLAATYRDFSGDARYAPALEFFLSDLYGPDEATLRDQALARASPLLKRALPGAALEVLLQALELAVLTLELDQAMAQALPGTASGTGYANAYRAAYRAVGRSAERLRQIDLILAIGTALGRIVARPWLATLLRAAHAPAHAAGLGVLQDFLERGYAAFRPLKGDERLFAAIRERETRFMNEMLEPNHV